GIAGAEDDVGESGDRFVAGAFEGRIRPGIERDEIDLGGNTGEQLYQGARLGRAVIDALQHYIFEGDAPRIAGARIGPAGLEQLGDRIFLVERHEHVAQLVGDRVQRDREVDAELGAAAADRRHHAGGGEGDLALRDRQALAVHDDLQRLRHIVVIVER